MNNTNIIISLVILYVFYCNITLENQKNFLYNQQVKEYNQQIIEYNTKLHNQKVEQYNRDVQEYNRQIEQSNSYYNDDYSIDYTYTANDIATLRAYGLRL